MSLFILPYPVFDPILVSIGPFPIRWYALAYIMGFILGLLYLKWLVKKPSIWGHISPPTPLQLEDLLIYVAFGVILGGRLFYVLTYNLPFYLSNWGEIFALWKGGMSFHGGLLGAFIGIALYAHRSQFPLLTLTDCVASVTPIGLFLGRIANFIKPELWGRPTDVPWAMIFEEAGPAPRHPSQLYEAGLEGLALFLFLSFFIYRGSLEYRGRVTGLFAIGYGVARILCEMFREPDPQLGFLWGGATMGQILSIPLLFAGGFCLYWAKHAKNE